MKRLVLSILLLIFSGGICSAQTQYVDARNEFSLVVPANWIKKDGALPANAVLVLDRSGGGAQVIVATVTGTDLPKLVESTAKYLKKEARQIEERNLRVQEVPAHLSVWEKGNTAIISTALLSGNRGYLLIAEVAQDHRAAGTEYRQILDSFRVVRGQIQAPPPPPNTQPPPLKPPVKDPQKGDLENDF